MADRLCSLRKSQVGGLKTPVGGHPSLTQVRTLPSLGKMMPNYKLLLAQANCGQSLTAPNKSSDYHDNE